MTERDVTGRLEAKVDELAQAMEKMKIAEYVDYLHNTRKMIVMNLIAGVARGLGMAIGFTILGALVIILLRRLVLLNLPVIGNLIAELVRLVNYKLNTGP